jgi:hypothetical protein
MLGCWMLDTGYWMLVSGCLIAKSKKLRAKSIGLFLYSKKIAPPVGAGAIH